MNYPHNIYIHVPFCMSRCNYCAFFSNACANPDWQKYADDICGEIDFWGNKIGCVDVPTIFFGGGTPSLMPVKIFDQIMNCINKNFNVDKNCEITLESNPGTIDKNKLKDFVQIGVNRLSVGVQSLNNDELNFLGRKHSVEQSINLLDTAQNLGLRVSADFIYGLPNHNVESIKKLCEQINKLDLSHVSMYELTIEKNTPFGRQNLRVPDNETMAKMYMAIPEYLSLPRYEVSNYARPGDECRHNQNIWWGGAYIGIGRAAAGRPYINGQWYDEMGNYEHFELLSDKTRAIEKIITGMRTIRGVLLDDETKNLIDMNWVANHKDLVVLSDKYLHAAPKGMLILDNIILELIK